MGSLILVTDLQHVLDAMLVCYCSVSGKKRKSRLWL